MFSKHGSKHNFFFGCIMTYEYSKHIFSVHLKKKKNHIYSEVGDGNMFNAVLLLSLSHLISSPYIRNILKILMQVLQF